MFLPFYYKKFVKKTQNFMYKKCLKFVPWWSLKHKIHFPLGGLSPWTLHQGIVLVPLGALSGPQTPCLNWCLYFILVLATSLGATHGSMLYANRWLLFPVVYISVFKISCLFVGRSKKVCCCSWSSRFSAKF